jgi:hypothetical protein
MFNLSLFYAADAAGNVCKFRAYIGFNYTGGANTQPATTTCTEVKMVPAAPHPLVNAVPAPVPPPGAETPADPDDPMTRVRRRFDPSRCDPRIGVPGDRQSERLLLQSRIPVCRERPPLPAGPRAGRPTEGWRRARSGTAGPPWVQIGTEGGVLPAPVVIPATPVGYNYNRRDVVVTNVQEHALFLGPAERADVIADFTNVPVGSTLILYNDSPAPVPGFDTRLDYYTGAPDLSSTGGAPTTQPGYGPNIRTIMQIRITGRPPQSDLQPVESAGGFARRFQEHPAGDHRAREPPIPPAPCQRNRFPPRTPMPGSRT